MVSHETVRRSSHSKALSSRRVSGCKNQGNPTPSFEKGPSRNAVEGPSHHDVTLTGVRYTGNSYRGISPKFLWTVIGTITLLFCHCRAACEPRTKGKRKHTGRACPGSGTNTGIRVLGKQIRRLQDACKIMTRSNGIKDRLARLKSNCIKGHPKLMRAIDKAMREYDQIHHKTKLRCADAFPEVIEMVGILRGALKQAQAKLNKFYQPQSITGIETLNGRMMECLQATQETLTAEKERKIRKLSGVKNCRETPRGKTSHETLDRLRISESDELVPPPPSSGRYADEGRPSYETGEQDHDYCSGGEGETPGNGSEMPPADQMYRSSDERETPGNGSAMPPVQASAPPVSQMTDEGKTRGRGNC